MSGVSANPENQHDGAREAPPATINGFSSPSGDISEVTEPSVASNVQNDPISSPLETGQPEIPRPHAVNFPPADAFESGYDSDNREGPFLERGVGEESNTLEHEDEQVAAIRQEQSEGEGGGISPELVPLAIEDVEKMKVKELRAELKKRGCAVNGNKPVLVERLSDAVRNNVPLVEELPQEVQDNMADVAFAPGAHWVPLENDGLEIDESGMTVEGITFRAPTTPEDEVVQQPSPEEEYNNTNATAAAPERVEPPKKKNFTATFDRPPFVAPQVLLPKMNARTGKPKTKRVNGKDEYVYELQYPDKTVPNLSFLFERDIGFHSHPGDWFELFLPVYKKKRGVSRPSTEVTVEDFTAWTNMKADMACAGEVGAVYPSFKRFKIEEIRSFLGLYILNGLSPSPRMEMKFKTQEEDAVNGNDLVARVFGKNGSLRHRHFKAFFGCVNPRINPPSTDTHPNFKIDPFLHHIMTTCKSVMYIGRKISVDEMDIGMQGQHADKQRITYKKAGDGFLVDALCSDGYMYSFYFRNQKAPRKWTDEGLSPLHARVLSLFEQLRRGTKNYDCKMDNPFMSAKFAKYAMCCSKIPVMIHGVTRPSGRGVPKCIEQQAVTRREDLIKNRGTVKAAKLVGDPACELVAVSVYDSKPVYLLSSSCTKIEWIKKDRKLYHKGLGKKVNVPFFRLNIIDDYNFDMNGVDVADQLRLQYRVNGHWFRNRKWWWAVFFWGFESLLTNCYVTYRKFHELHQRKPMSHYDFLKKIALAWLDPDLFHPKKKEVVVQEGGGECDDDSSRSEQRSSSSSRATRSSSRTTRSGSSSRTTKKCERFTDNSLDPNNGSLRCRLRPELGHLPEELENKPEANCQLHYYLYKKKHRARLMYCPCCNCIICLECYKTFHTVRNLRGMKHMF